jgi:hypothetical protein
VAVVVVVRQVPQHQLPVPVVLVVVATVGSVAFHRLQAELQTQAVAAAVQESQVAETAGTAAPA